MEHADGARIGRLRGAWHVDPAHVVSSRGRRLTFSGIARQRWYCRAFVMAANRVIVILGMDRSGTSLCTDLLNCLGMRLGPGLVPGDQFNETGYFEDLEIWSIHQRIFAVLGRSWDTLTVIRPLPPLWWRTEGMQRFKAQMTELVRARNSDGPRLWGFKDPRTAMLLPLWDEVFQTCGVHPVFVLCVRHPAGVVESLAARDGFPALFSELLWLERNLNACQAIHDSPHCLAHYENWFRDPLGQAKRLIEVTGVTPPTGTEELRDCISRTVRPGLRHDKPGTSSICSAAAREFYAHLRYATKAPGAEVLRSFVAALATARDYAAVAQQLTGRSLTAGMQSPAYEECTAEEVEAICRGLPLADGADTPDGDRALLRSDASALTTQLPGLPMFLPLFSLEKVAGVVAPIARKDQPALVAQQGDLVVIGWAFDGATARPASAVEVAIDGIPFRADYGTGRPDVAEHFGVPDYVNCGFTFTMKARQLSRGQHVLAVRVVSTDGSQYWQSPEVLLVVI